MKIKNKSTNQGYLIFIALTAALGGFLFGYDTAVISGTISFVKTKFVLNTVMEGWFVSSALVGCIAGVSVAGELSDRFGRKSSLIVSGILFTVSAVGCAFSASHTELILYRLIGGIGVGVASMLSPLYISEVSPANIRGRMVALYQFAITIGILCAYFANASLLNLSKTLNLEPGGVLHQVMIEEVWRAMFGSETIPAILFLILMFFVPKSPRWLATKNKIEKAERVLTRINPGKIVKPELQSIQTAIAKEKNASWGVLFSKGIRIAVFAGMGLGILSQFTGINAIIYYGPRIMEEAGIQIGDALGGQVVIGLVNMLATIYAIIKIDKFGRKKLMLGGITGMFFSLIIVGILFFIGKSSGVLLLIFILTFITSFAIGIGPVIWVLLSEIYPTKVRGRAMSLATLSLWMGTAIIGQLVPWMLETLTPAGTFWVFALFCIPVPFILKLLPETKTLSLEKIEEFWLSD
jgi:sugar porter (SP) family MFS transporter